MGVLMSKIKAIISARDLRRLAWYEPETGHIFWRARTPDMFTNGEQSASHSCAIWNKRFAGKRAFNANNGQGYLSGRIWSAKCFAHRAAWALAYGEWPAEQIDHINGDRADNRLVNLRAVSVAENGKNQRLRVTNTSGHMGVVKAPNSDDRWIAQIKCDGRAAYLGTYETKDAAILARKRAEAARGFHPNHGRAA
jgi:hypothetical protein